MESPVWEKNTGENACDDWNEEAKERRFSDKCVHGGEVRNTNEYESCCSREGGSATAISNSGF